MELKSQIVDYEKLKSQIPSDWVKINHSEIMRMTAVNFRLLIDKAAENNGCPKPYSKEQMDTVFRLESKRMGIPESLLRKLICTNSSNGALMVLFSQEYGHLLPHDPEHGPMIPIDLIERCFGPVGKRIADEVRDGLRKKEGLKMYLKPQSNI